MNLAPEKVLFSGGRISLQRRSSFREDAPTSLKRGTLPAPRSGSRPVGSPPREFVNGPTRPLSFGHERGPHDPLHGEDPPRHSDRKDQCLSQKRAERVLVALGARRPSLANELRGIRGRAIATYLIQL